MQSRCYFTWWIQCHPHNVSDMNFWFYLADYCWHNNNKNNNKKIFYIAPFRILKSGRWGCMCRQVSESAKCARRWVGSWVRGHRPQRKGVLLCTFWKSPRKVHSGCVGGAGTTGVFRCVCLCERSVNNINNNIFFSFWDLYHKHCGGRARPPMACP